VIRYLIVLALGKHNGQGMVVVGAIVVLLFRFAPTRRLLAVPLVRALAL
jgi:hypothetical protein